MSSVFQDACFLRTECGQDFPLERRNGLYVWPVRSATDLRTARCRVASTHAPPNAALTTFAVHSSRRSSHIAAMNPGVAAAHLHRRLHVGRGQAHGHTAEAYDGGWTPQCSQGKAQCVPPLRDRQRHSFAAQREAISLAQTSL